MNNLKSYTEYAVTTPTTDFVIGFDFNYGTDAVNITVDDIPATEAGYTVIYLNSTTMRLSPAVPSGVVRLQRETDIDVPDNRFTAGAKFITSNMDENFTQIRKSQQEVRDGFEKLSEDTYEIIDTLQVVGQAAQDAADAAEQAAQTANDAAAQVNDKVSYQDLDDAVDTAVQSTVAEGVPATAIKDASGQSQQGINDTRIKTTKDYAETDAGLKAAILANTELRINSNIDVQSPWLEETKTVDGVAGGQLYATGEGHNLLLVGKQSDITVPVERAKVFNVDFGSQPVVANDNVAALHFARSKEGIAAFNTFKDTNTGIRVAYSLGGYVSQDNMQLGNVIVSPKTMGIELIQSKYNRTIGNLVHNNGVRLGLHGLRWSGDGVGNIAVGNNFRDRNSGGISLQVGNVNGVAVGNYFENIGGSAIQSNATTAWDVRAFLGGFVAKNSGGNGVDIEYMRNTFIQGVVDGAASSGVRTDTTNGKHVIDMLIANTGSTAATIRSGKNLVKVLVDSNTAGTPVSVSGNDNLIIVLCADTTVTNSVFITGSNNVVLVQEAGSGAVSIRSDGDNNTIIGNAKGGLVINGSYTTFSGCVAGNLTIGASAVNTAVSGQVRGSITDNGTNTNLTGLCGGYASGSVTATTTTGGLITIQHGLKKVPKSIRATVAQDSPYNAVIVARNTNSFTVKILNLTSSGALVASTSVAIDWSVDA